MAVWHEPMKHIGGWIFPPRDGGRVAVVFTGEDVREAPHRGHFLRYEGDGPVPKGFYPVWRKEPAGWFELWPREPLLASSMDEARDRFTPLLPGLEDGSTDEHYKRNSYEPPGRPTRIEEIEHPTHRAHAVIVKHSDGHFEVGYLVYAPNGKYFPAATPSISEELDWEWGVTWTTDESGRDLRTLADDLESARPIATTELEAIVALDPEIRRRCRLAHHPSGRPDPACPGSEAETPSAGSAPIPRWVRSWRVLSPSPGGQGTSHPTERSGAGFSLRRGSHDHVSAGDCSCDNQTCVPVRQ